jgi:hypothetical protein
MIIKIICPICKANNDLSAFNTTCRRCREDLCLMYQIKGYSYKYRLIGMQLIANQRLQEGAHLLQIARSLDKSFE